LCQSEGKADIQLAHTVYYRIQIDTDRLVLSIMKVVLKVLHLTKEGVELGKILFYSSGDPQCCRPTYNRRDGFSVFDEMKSASKHADGILLHLQQLEFLNDLCEN
jgi:hypothetical protein